MYAAWHSNYQTTKAQCTCQCMMSFLILFLNKSCGWRPQFTTLTHPRTSTCPSMNALLRCMVKFDKPNKMSPYKSKTPASCNWWISRLGFTIKISVYISLYCSCFSSEVTVQFTIRASRHFMALSKVGMNDYAIECKPGYNYFTRSTLKHAHFDDEITFPALSYPLIWGCRVSNCFWCR